MSRIQIMLAVLSVILFAIVVEPVIVATAHSLTAVSTVLARVPH